ncbi:MAG: DegT/DnrJ/EryC1/StrS family aminotransferase, partial [Candidatus Hodarchaeota archaeon]
MCNKFGVKYCIATDLGRQAITLALIAAGLKPGDGVVLPSLVCQSVLLPILRLGCVPQFADIGEDLNISPETVSRVIDEQTRAIIVPHLYGRAAQIERIADIAKRHGVTVIDDAAQALGAKRSGKYVGSFGDVGIFSFGPFKSIIATRGGALVTNNGKIYKKIQERLPLSGNIDTAFVRAVKSLIKFKFRRYCFFYLSKRAKDAPTYQEESEVNFAEIDPVSMSDMDAAIA